MNDRELDLLVATLARVDDGWVGTLDLRDAEGELMEQIVSTSRTTAVDVPQEPPAPGAPEPAAGDVSPFTARVRRSRATAALGLAAALVIAVLAGAVLTRDGGDDDSGLWAAAGSALMPAIVDPIPDGFEVGLAGEDSAPAPDPGAPDDTWVYGNVTETAVTDDIVIRVAPQPPVHPVLSEPMTVRGVPGRLCSPGPTPCEFPNAVTGVTWREPSGPYVTVVSRTYDEEQVRAIAEGVIVEGGSVTLGTLPAGVTAPPLAAALHDDGDPAYYVVYQDRNSSIMVQTRARTEAMGVHDLWMHGPREDGDVNGHPAAVEDVGGGAYVVSWAPVPRQLIEVFTNGMSESAALDAARTVRPATPEEWADLRARAPQPALANVPEAAGVEEPPDDATYLHLADGTEVWGWLGDSGGPCYLVAEDGGGGGVARLCTSEPAAVRGVSPSSTKYGPTVRTPAAVGIAPPGTVSIDGANVTFGEDVADGRVFACGFTSGEIPTTVTFRDAGGAALGTAEVVVS